MFNLKPTHTMSMGGLPARHPAFAAQQRLHEAVRLNREERIATMNNANLMLRILNDKRRDLIRLNVIHIIENYLIDETRCIVRDVVRVYPDGDWVVREDDSGYSHALVLKELICIAIRCYDHCCGNVINELAPLPRSIDTAREGLQLIVRELSAILRRHKPGDALLSRTDKIHIDSETLFHNAAVEAVLLGTHERVGHASPFREVLHRDVLDIIIAAMAPRELGHG
jgi:hypothetical protein